MFHPQKSLYQKPFCRLVALKGQRMAMTGVMLNRPAGIPSESKSCDCKLLENGDPQGGLSETPLGKSKSTTDY